MSHRTGAARVPLLITPGINSVVGLILQTPRATAFNRSLERGRRARVVKTNSVTQEMKI